MGVDRLVALLGCDEYVQLYARPTEGACGIETVADRFGFCYLPNMQRWRDYPVL